MKRFGFYRFTSPSVRDSTKGWRLVVPVWISYGRRYEIYEDEFVTDWWAWTLALSVERLASHGVMLRLTWGAIGLALVKPPASRPELVWSRTDG